MAREDDLDYKLEKLVDATSLAKVCDMLSGISGQKAEHIRENWQDAPLARKWDAASTRLHKLASDFRKRNL
jgi:hypothetical protein